MTLDEHRFAALDAWRGVAACFVVLVHFTGWPGGQSHLAGFSFIKNAGLWVDFFFVLSGFVITHAALGKLCDAATAGKFLLRRFGRLWPLHVAILAAFVALSVAKSAATHGSAPVFGQYNSLQSVLYNLLLIQALHMQSWPMWNAPSWSISVEFYTYFIFAGVFLLCANLKRSTIGPALGIMAISLAVLVRVNGGMTVAIDYGIFRCAYGFFAGHLTYLVWRNYRNSNAVLEWVAVAMCAGFVTFGAIPVLRYFAPIVFGFAIWVFAGEIGPISRFGKSPPMQMLGAFSYSIYMTHWMLIHILTGAVPLMDARFGTHLVYFQVIKALAVGAPDVRMPILVMPNYWVGDLAAFAFLAVVIAFSAMTYRYIENPSRAFFNRIANRREPVPFGRQCSLQPRQTPI